MGGSPGLQHGIRACKLIAVAAGAVQSFESFMRRALYDPRLGYYSRRIQGVGGRGDFTTAPMLSDGLGRAVARWVRRAMAECSCRNLIEIGPGEGLLALAVLRNLPLFTRWRGRIHLVETSEPLAAIQRSRLGRLAVWHRTPQEALAACGGRAVIYSNELVDAFPVRRFRKTAGGWREMGVIFDHTGTPSEQLLDGELLPESSSFAAGHTAGQCVETHESYRRWLDTWLPLWHCGRMLTIDYGGMADTIYQRRPHGTVRAYFMRQRLEGPAIYQNIGFQDLTADVNFTDLMDWSRPWMRAQRLETLAEFLANTVDGPIADPDGAGGAFLVLDQLR